MLSWARAVGGGTVSAVRVIAGSNRGRRLRVPAGGATRPTADRVREAVFDILGSLVDLDGAHVADLFAGSGAMGIEALSRGASSVVFVDRDRAAVDAVRANLADLGLVGPAATVVRAEVLTWLAGRTGTPPPATFDLVVCDPPYAFDQWERLLALVRGRLVVLESNRPVPVPGGWETVRCRRYGGTLVTVIRPQFPVEEGRV